MEKEHFLSLVRLGSGHSASNAISDVDLAAVKDLADKQGLSAVVLDGVDVLRKNDNHNVNLNLQEKILLAEWIGEVHQFYELRYKQYLQTIAEMAGFYNRHGFKMMILKGYACSLDWPKPNHRPCGDIDIWMFGQQKEADALLNDFRALKARLGAKASKNLNEGHKFKVDRSHHHHTVFTWNDFMVENHYDFINVHAHKSSRELEKVLKALGQDDSHTTEVYGETVYLPSANLHALFLLKHMVSHFAAAEINLRQVLDWAFFVKKHTDEIDWNWLVGVLEEFGMKKFFCCINAICVEDLGFDMAIFMGVQFKPQLKDRVLADILEPAYEAESPKNLIPRITYKYKRWKGNAWKHDMCYKESRWSTFCTGFCAKLMKPSSI